MATVRLSGGEKRALVLWVLAGAAGLWYAQRHFFEAFPEASVNFAVTRGEALERGKNFLESMGQSMAGYRSVIVFGVDDNAKTYLEREVGLKEANQLMVSQVNVWNWEVRFFKPEQEEEFQVGVSPEGKITGYTHKIPEAKAGGQPDREWAQNKAQDFLLAKLGKSAADWEFLTEEANSTKKPNRLDWSFTWEKHGFKAKDAPERLKIELHGAQIGSATEALKVPEQWQRDYRHLRSTNEFYNTVAIIPYFLLLGAVLWMGIQLTRQGKTSWRLALQLGVVVTLLVTAMELNKWPQAASSYKTTDAYGSFVIMLLLGALIFGFVSALTVALPLPGGEPLYRDTRPEFLRLKRALSWRGMRTKEFFSATVVGLSLAAAQMGFLVAFYLIANHFGAWSPQEVPYDDSLNTSIPWVGGLAIGLLAATSEEFLFRLFAIPFLQKYTKSTALAVILPAFAWGFLHTAYPNEPPYIRGLEVGLIGVAVGIVYLRWGILTTLIWHYTVDASLVGLLLIRASSWYFRISGIVVGLAVLIPFSANVYCRLRRGTFEPDEDLLNQAPDALEVRKEEEAPRVTEAAPTAPLSAGIRGFLALCLVLAGLAALKLKPVHLGDYLKLSVSANEAHARAEQVLKQHGVDPRSYHSVTTFADATDAIANEYLRQKIGVAKLNEIYDQRVPGALWATRFFRDGQAEEYSVALRPDGSPYSVQHRLAEAAQGASLAKDEAVSKASAFLQNTKNLDLSRWTLDDSTSQKRPNRVDHELIWQENQALDSTDPAAQAGDPTNHAFARIQITVMGDEVTNYRTYVKIPDEWRRKQESESIWRTLHTVLVICLAAAVVVAVLVFRFLLRIKSDLMKALPWRRLAAWGVSVWAAYVAVIAFGSRIPETLRLYNTAIPLKFMYGGLAIGFTLGSAAYLGLFVILFAMGWFFLRQAYGPEAQLPGWRGMPAAYYRDAIFIGIGGTAGLVALSRATEWLARQWPTPHRAFPASFGTNFDSFFPGLAISATAVLQGLLLTGVIAALCGFVIAHCKAPIVRLLLFVATSLAMVSGWGSPADFVKQWLAQAIFLAAVVFGIAKVVRMNLLGYFLVLAIPELLLGAVEMLSQPNGFYHTQGILCMVALAALIAWPLLAWLTAKSSATAEPAAQ